MRLPNTTIKRDEKYVTIRIPLRVAAAMTQEYWDMLATNTRRLLPDVTPIQNLTAKVKAP
jgi:hypothetical protein